MPDYRRTHVSGGTYFFTVNTYRRRSMLMEDNVRQALRQGIERARRTLPFEIDAWVLLPDHLHCLWTLPLGDNNYSARWAIIKREVSRCCGNDVQEKVSESMRKRGERGIWQRRFWEHLIRDESDLRRHADYIHWNPVKHGYVRRVVDWPYSTFHRYVRQGVYPSDWGGVTEDDREGEYGE
jgi:putative transposase